MLKVNGSVYEPGASVVQTQRTLKQIWLCVLAVATPAGITLCAAGAAGSEVNDAPQVPTTAFLEYATSDATFSDAVNVAVYVNDTVYGVFDLAVTTGPVN